MSKCWYCNEELTTANYCDEHIGICTKCYNSMFKVSNEFVKGLTDRITDLEAKLAEKEQEINDISQNYDFQINDFSREVYRLQKREKILEQQLAESEKEIKEWIAVRNDKNNVINKQTEKINQLKQQLAEKEKEIEELNKFMSDKADEIEDLKERISNKITSAYGAELMAKDVQWHLEKEIQELKQSQNQMTIAELERVKEFAEKNKFVVSDYHNLDLAELNYGICFENLYKQIDNQIKKLRGGM